MRELLIFCDMILDVAQKGGKERSCLRQSMAMENNGQGHFSQGAEPGPNKGLYLP